jgi:hypothetical protein
MEIEPLNDLLSRKQIFIRSVELEQVSIDEGELR